MNPESSSPVPVSPPPRGAAHHLIFSLLSLVVVVAAAGAVYLWQHHRVENLTTQLAHAQTQARAASAATSQATSTQAQPYLYLYSYGVKIPLTSDIKDLYYVDEKQSGDNLLAFSTQSLAQADDSCLAVPFNYAFSYQSLDADSSADQIQGSPFGSIEVLTTPASTSQVGDDDEQIGTLVAHANGYYFYRHSPQSACSTDSSTQTLVTQQTQSFLAAIKKMEAI